MVLSSDKNLGRVFRSAMSFVLSDVAVCLLFFIILIFDAVALLALFLAPSWPFSLLLAPIIRTFWTERFLHYPDNFILLPKLFNHAHFLLSAFLGVFVTAVVIKKIESLFSSRKLSVLTASGFVFKKYIGLVVAWAAAYGIFSFLAEKLLGLIPKMPAVQLPVAYIFALILQALFAYILPVLLLEEGNYFKRFGSAVSFGARHFAFTCTLIAIPILVAVAVSFAKAFSPYFIKVYPEAVLWVLAFSILASLIVDVVVTASTTVFYLEARNTHK